MKDQINTIREFFLLPVPHSPQDTLGYGRAKVRAEIAVSQIEAAVGEQEPVAWKDGGDLELMRKHGRGCIAWAQEQNNAKTPLYAAPVAQQPRGEVVVTWNRDLTRILAVTRQDREGRILKVIAEAPAQQPQEPDWKHPKIQALIGADARNGIVIDLIWQILKDPEGNFSAMDMEYWDDIHDAVQAAVTKAQQPQYPLPDDLYPDSKDWAAGTYAERVEWLHTMYESQRALVAEYERQLTQQPQAEAVRPVQIVNCKTCKHSGKSCDDYPCRNCGVEFGDGPFNRWEAPQQAEAVPSDVVRDAMVEAACGAVAAALGDAYDCGRVWSAWSYGTMGPDDFSQVSEDSDRVREIAVAAIDAAIAQQKGQP